MSCQLLLRVPLEGAAADEPTVTLDCRSWEDQARLAAWLDQNPAKLDAIRALCADLDLWAPAPAGVAA